MRHGVVLVDPGRGFVDRLPIHFQPWAQLPEHLLVDRGQGTPRRGAYIDQDVSIKTRDIEKIKNCFTCDCTYVHVNGVNCDILFIFEIVLQNGQAITKVKNFSL